MVKEREEKAKTALAKLHILSQAPGRSLKRRNGAFRGNFCFVAKGSLYLLPPSGWNQDKWQSCFPVYKISRFLRLYLSFMAIYRSGNWTKAKQDWLYFPWAPAPLSRLWEQAEAHHPQQSTWWHNYKACQNT